MFFFPEADLGFEL